MPPQLPLLLPPLPLLLPMQLTAAAATADAAAAAANADTCRCCRFAANLAAAADATAAANPQREPQELLDMYYYSHIASRDIAEDWEF
jgi:hypothetical protein